RPERHPLDTYLDASWTREPVSESTAFQAATSIARAKIRSIEAEFFQVCRHLLPLFKPSWTLVYAIGFAGDDTPDFVVTHRPHRFRRSTDSYYGRAVTPAQRSASSLFTNARMWVARPFR